MATTTPRRERSGWNSMFRWSLAAVAACFLIALLTPTVPAVLSLAFGVAVVAAVWSGLVLLVRR